MADPYYEQPEPQPRDEDWWAHEMEESPDEDYYADSDRDDDEGAR